MKITDFNPFNWGHSITCDYIDHDTCGELCSDSSIWFSIKEGYIKTSENCHKKITCNCGLEQFRKMVMDAETDEKEKEAKMSHLSHRRI